MASQRSRSSKSSLSAKSAQSPKNPKKQNDGIWGCCKRKKKPPANQKPPIVRKSIYEHRPLEKTIPAKPRIPPRRPVASAQPADSAKPADPTNTAPSAKPVDGKPTEQPKNSTKTSNAKTDSNRSSHLSKPEAEDEKGKRVVKKSTSDSSKSKKEEEKEETTARQPSPVHKAVGPMDELIIRTVEENGRLNRTFSYVISLPLPQKPKEQKPKEQKKPKEEEKKKEKPKEEIEATPKAEREQRCRPKLRRLISISDFECIHEDIKNQQKPTVKHIAVQNCQSKLKRQQLGDALCQTQKSAVKVRNNIEDLRLLVGKNMLPGMGNFDNETGDLLREMDQLIENIQTLSSHTKN